MAVPLQPLRPAKPRRASKHEAGLFQYQALESQNTFRLLRLHAGQGERIDCSIHHYTLNSATCPSYRAVSYTWSKDAARSSIHLPGDSVIKVRENLRDALRSVRDKESDCWLWIDAICINQRSDQERNHQVRLMADIYGNANVVLVWLQSAGESADVARAFKFIHAAATYDDSEHSVYAYSRAHPIENARNWRSVHNLCKLRYWTRKWIIQELVAARTVVLQTGKSKCSITDLERLCSQLHLNRYNNAYKKIASEGRHIWVSVLASQAARLALQRLEAASEQQPRLLHEMVERYARSECHLPCDHVYALYSLVGDHRRHLRVDYAASPVQRLVAVIRFVHVHERLVSSKVLEFANLLVKLFQIRQEEFIQERRLSENLDLVVPATILGTVILQSESEASIALRRLVKPLPPIPIFMLHTWQDTWVVSGIEDPSEAQGRVGRQDMIFFSVANSGFYGLAACRLEPGDIIWHFPQTFLVFAVRTYPDLTARVLGRAYLFSVPRGCATLEPWLKRPVDYGSIRQGERRISLNLATLLEFGSLAIPEKDAGTDLMTSEKTSWSLSHVKGLWKRNWTRRVVAGGCALIVIFVIVVIIIQVIKQYC